MVILTSGTLSPTWAPTCWLDADGVTSVEAVSWLLHLKSRESLSHRETSPSPPEPVQQHRYPAGRWNKTWEQRFYNGGSGIGGGQGVLDYLFTYLFIYLFSLPVMAGVHGCGCWEAGAVSPTKASRSSAWARRGPIRHIPTSTRIKCSSREQSTSWAASGSETTAWWCKRKGGR